MPLDLAFLKGRYDFELDHKDKLTGSLTLPVGILTALGGLIAVMARSFTYQDRALTQWFLGFLAFDLVAFVGCLVGLGVAWHRHGYEYMPFVGELERARQEFEAYYHDDPTTAAQEFEARLRRSIIEAADTNTQNNDDRSKYLYWARIGLFAILTLSALAGVPYVLDQVGDRMSNENQTHITQQQPERQPVRPSTSAPAPTNPPAFPVNRIIREGGTSTEKK